MTQEDRAFLASVYLPCGGDPTELDLASLTTAEIQNFAVVFKVLDGNNKYTVSLLTAITQSLTFFATLVIMRASFILGVLFIMLENYLDSPWHRKIHLLYTKGLLNSRLAA